MLPVLSAVVAAFWPPPKKCNSYFSHSIFSFQISTVIFEAASAGLRRDGRCQDAISLRFVIRGPDEFTTYYGRNNTCRVELLFFLFFRAAVGIYDFKQLAQLTAIWRKHIYVMGGVFTDRTLTVGDTLTTSEQLVFSFPK